MNKRIKKKKRKQKIVFIKMCKLESNKEYLWSLTHTYPFPKDIKVNDCSGIIEWK